MFGTTMLRHFHTFEADAIFFLTSHVLVLFLGGKLPSEFWWVFSKCYSLQLLRTLLLRNILLTHSKMSLYLQLIDIWQRMYLVYISFVCYQAMVCFCGEISCSSECSYCCKHHCKNVFNVSRGEC